MNTSRKHNNSSSSYPWPTRSTGVISMAPPAEPAGPRSSALSQQPPLSWGVLLPTFVSVAVLIMLVLGQKAQVVSSQYALVKLKGQLSQLHKQQAELKIRLQRLSALERIDTLARTKLHMAAPGERMVLDLSLPRVASRSEHTVGYTSATGFSEGSF